MVTSLPAALSSSPYLCDSSLLRSNSAVTICVRGMPSKDFARMGDAIQFRSADLRSSVRMHQRPSSYRSYPRVLTCVPRYPVIHEPIHTRSRTPWIMLHHRYTWVFFRHFRFQRLFSNRPAAIISQHQYHVNEGKVCRTEDPWKARPSKPTSG